MKAVIDRLEDVGEGLRGEYELHDGKFHLRVEGEPRGYVPDTFRNNNIGQAKKITKLETELKLWTDLGVDVETVRAKLTGEPKSDPLAEAQARLDAERQAHAATKFEHRFGFVALKHGVDPAMVKYLLPEAAKQFRMEGEEIVAITAGQSLDQWVSSLATSAPRFFLPSFGSGATGGTGGPSRLDSRKTITSDPVEFGKNLEDIASGAVVVRD